MTNLLEKYIHEIAGYHGSHKPDLTELIPRQLEKTFNALGVWITSSKSHAFIYGPKIYEVEIPEGKYLDANIWCGSTGTNDWVRLFYDHTIIQDFLSPQTKYFFSTELGSAWKGYLNVRNSRPTPRWGDWTPQQDAQINAVMKDVENIVFRNWDYLQLWKQSWIAGGYDGLVWKDSLIDVGANRDKGRHDVYCIWNKESLPAKMIEQSTVKNYVRNLLEITRYERETGTKYDAIEELRKLATQIHPATHAFTMVDIEKIGINPGTEFETPAGIYFYPLTEEMLEQLENGSLPWGNDRKFVGIVKLKDASSKDWLYFDENLSDAGNFSDKDVINIAEKLAKYQKDQGFFPNQSITQARLEMLDEAENDGMHWQSGPDAQIFDLTYFASTKMHEQLAADYQYKRNGSPHPKQTILWNKILRWLGFEGLYDCGASVIHENEPTQICALSSSAYKVVAIISRSEIQKAYKTSSDDTLIKIAKSTKTIDKLREFAKSSVNDVRLAVVRNKNCPADLLLTLATDKDDAVKCNITENPNCSKEIFNILAKDDEPHVRTCVAIQTSSPQLLLQMSLDKSNWVKEAVARNFHTQDEALQNIVKSELAISGIFWTHILDEVIRNPNTSLETLKLMYTSKTVNDGIKNSARAKAHEKFGKLST